MSGRLLSDGPILRPSVKRITDVMTSLGKPLSGKLRENCKQQPSTQISGMIETRVSPRDTLCVVVLTSFRQGLTGPQGLSFTYGPPARCTTSRAHEARSIQSAHENMLPRLGCPGLGKPWSVARRGIRSTSYLAPSPVLEPGTDAQCNIAIGFLTLRGCQQLDLRGAFAACVFTGVGLVVAW
jgi:hypothetical protein